MADINITGSSSNPVANNYTVGQNQTTVSFHSANAAVQVCFSNYNTFNAWGVPVPQGGSNTVLTIHNRESTDYTVNASTYTCPTGAKATDATQYTITIGGGMGGGKKPDHETYKK